MEPEVWVTERARHTGGDNDKDGPQRQALQVSKTGVTWLNFSFSEDAHKRLPVHIAKATLSTIL